jgi:hypothetical protein
VENIFAMKMPDVIMEYASVTMDYLGMGSSPVKVDMCL